MITAINSNNFIHIFLLEENPINGNSVNIKDTWPN